jgi:hypothetical protein
MNAYQQYRTTRQQGLDAQKQATFDAYNKVVNDEANAMDVIRKFPRDAQGKIVGPQLPTQPPGAGIFGTGQASPDKWNAYIAAKAQYPQDKADYDAAQATVRRSELLRKHPAFVGAGLTQPDTADDQNYSDTLPDEPGGLTGQSSGKTVTAPSGAAQTDQFIVGKQYKDASGNTATYQGNGQWSQ